MSSFGISVRCQRCLRHVFFVGVRIVDGETERRSCFRFPCPRCGASNPREIVGTVEPGSLTWHSRD